MSQPLSHSSLPAPAASGNAMTAEELFRLPDDSWRYALVSGELQRMTPAGFRHGTVIMNVAVPLAQHVKSRRLGVVCGAETGFVLSPRHRATGPFSQPSEHRGGSAGRSSQSRQIEKMSSSLSSSPGSSGDRSVSPRPKVSVGVRAPAR